MIAEYNGPLMLMGLFIFKHFLADFVLQTHRHIVGKEYYGRWAGVEHSFHHGILTFLVVVPFVNLSTALLIGLIDTIVHYHIDYVKARFGTKDISKKSHWTWFGADQMLHYLTYLAIVLNCNNSKMGE